ncbi:MAG: permease prefix domain 2-containing transporter, partial [Bacteroidota bacterium]
MKSPKPPKLALRLLRAFCRPDYLVDIEGDLRELFLRRVDQMGRRKAVRRLYKDIFFLFRPGIIKSVHHHLVFTHPIMLKNYLLITWRTMLRNPFYAVLNILGLAICVAAT